jgi:DNA invertase Pin-like site-specific DNA recombinase
MAIAVIYARYSDSKQTEQSIEGQLKVCHKYAESNGYAILNEYIYCLTVQSFASFCLKAWYCKQIWIWSEH